MLVFAAVAYDVPRTSDQPVIDETLFHKISAGKKEAFEELYLQTSASVYAYALSLLRNRQDAEDALQDTYLKIRSAAHLYRPMGKPMAWILTITKNICLMKLRSAVRSPLLPLEENTAPDLGLDRISDLEDRMVLETAFLILSDEERQIIILHAVSGMKHKEISELFQIPLSTILSKYRRGLKKLRAELEGRL